MWLLTNSTTNYSLKKSGKKFTKKSTYNGVAIFYNKEIQRNDFKLRAVLAKRMSSHIQAYIFIHGLNK